MRPLRAVVFLVALFPGFASADVPAEGGLPYCGTIYTPPFGAEADAKQRECTASQPRGYSSKYNGIAKRALDLESAACFVPDQSYKLLDDIVDEVHARASREGLSTTNTDRKLLVIRLSAITGDVLVSRGFQLYIPTRMLSDALQFRQAVGEPPRHVVDCDTGSLILLEVAESFGLPAALVDITLPSGSGHNYVRWPLGGQEWLDWDTNGREECQTPPGLPSYEGTEMSGEQTTAYLTQVRAGFLKEQGRYAQALSDYRTAIRFDPRPPGVYNNLAWLIATSQFTGRERYRGEAVRLARKAVALEPSANYRDTLACAVAYSGNFALAVQIEREAVSKNPTKREFTERLAMFSSATPTDCTGMK